MTFILHSNIKRNMNEDVYPKKKRRKDMIVLTETTNSTETMTTRYCTWLVFMNNTWVPFDQTNQYKLDQTLELHGTFVDIQDSHFPSVKKVRVFPKSNHLSYLGVKYRISKVMQTDVWDFI